MIRNAASQVTPISSVGAVANVYHVGDLPPTVTRTQPMPSRWLIRDDGTPYWPHNG